MSLAVHDVRGRERVVLIQGSTVLSGGPSVTALLQMLSSNGYSLISDRVVCPFVMRTTAALHRVLL